MGAVKLACRRIVDEVDVELLGKSRGGLDPTLSLVRFRLYILTTKNFLLS